MIDNDCDGKIDCTDSDCAPAQCVNGSQSGQSCSTDAGIQACVSGGGFCQCPHIQKDPTTIRLRTRPALDLLRSHGRVTIFGPVDVVGSEAAWLLSNARGRIFSATLPPNSLTANGSGTVFRYGNPDARLNGGIYRVLIRIRNGTSYAYTVEAYGDMSAATDALMSLQFYFGQQRTPAFHTEAWKRQPHGWRADQE